MNRWRAGVTAVFAALLVSGCVAFEFGDSGQITPDAAAKLERQVPTYMPAQLEGIDNYIRAGSVDAVQCQHGLFSSANEESVINTLRQKAAAAGANGLTDVSCEPGPIDEFKGCLASIACQATMIKTVTPDTAGK